MMEPWSDVRAAILAKQEARKAENKTRVKKPRGKRPVTWDVVQGRALWDAGVPPAHIAHWAGVDRATVQCYAKKHGWPVNEARPRQRKPEPRHDLRIARLIREREDEADRSGPFGLHPEAPYARAVRQVEQETNSRWQDWRAIGDPRAERACDLARDVIGIDPLRQPARAA